jgi:hypothetical protein
MHLLLRPALAESATVTFPDVEQACEFFAEAFVRAVSTGCAQASAPSTPASPA